MKLLDAFLSSLLFIIPLTHLLLAPHTKVEESFNIQAIHDILVYGTPTHDVRDRFFTLYDHFSFPGAVPRTFVGAVVLSGISQPLVFLAGFRHGQFVVRAVLGAFNAGCLLVFKDALARAFGKGAARWWTVLLVSQFHVMYYLTRTLPNMFAFGLTTLAFAFMLPKSSELKATRRRKQAIIFLTLSAVIFRSELAILLATSALYLLATGQMTLGAMAPVFIMSFLGSLLISVPIDSYFWQEWLWPELWGFYYNAVLGASSNWGVSPWHYYFSSALPRLLLNPLSLVLSALALFHPATSRSARQLAVPSLLFVAVYSLQPHKEARFIFYVVPPLTACAALGANFLSSRMSKSLGHRLATYAVAASVPVALCLSTGMLLMSSLNYPGGDALTQLQALTADDPASAVVVHADVLTCMTGLTLFGQNPFGLPLATATPNHVGPDPDTPLMLVDKTERNVTLGWPRFWNRVDYALVENPALPIGDWEILGVVQGFDGLEIMTPVRGLDEAVEANKEQPAGEDKILGLGATIAEIRQAVRKFTGGWWVGPRMSPRIRIMKKLERV